MGDGMALSKTREALLDEVRVRYDAEHARHDQLYTRLGVYLGILAIYGNALVRFFDRPPSITGTATTAWGVAVWLLVALTALAFVCLVTALAGARRGPMYSPNPSVWAGRIEELEKYTSERLRSAGVASPTDEQIDDAVASELKQDFEVVLREAADANIESNAWRFGWLHWAARFVAGGALALLVATVSYAYILTVAPPTADATVQLAAPVEVKTSTLRVEPVSIDSATVEKLRAVLEETCHVRQEANRHQAAPAPAAAKAPAATAP